MGATAEQLSAEPVRDLKHPPHGHSIERVRPDTVDGFRWKSDDPAATQRIRGIGHRFVEKSSFQALFYLGLRLGGLRTERYGLRRPTDLDKRT